MYELISKHTQAVLGGKGSGKTTFLVLEAQQLMEEKRKVILIDCGGVINKQKLEASGLKTGFKLFRVDKSLLDKCKDNEEHLKLLLGLMLKTPSKITVIRLELTSMEQAEYFDLISQIGRAHV